MADTAGLQKSRKEWNEAVSMGETELPHAEWYEQKYAAEKKKKNKDTKLALLAAED